MKHNFIRYIMIVLMIGLVILTSRQSQAQGNQKDKHIELLSASWGIAPRQTARISLANLTASRRLSRTDDPVIARIQILDMEGEVIAQSDEIRVEQGKIRFWDVPRDRFPAGEPNGRIQVRTRILFATQAIFIGGVLTVPSLAPTMELINPSTGETAALITVEWVFVA
ncbi:MAG: hypothetical protein MOB07_16160 [Acidobacteria bacterium]|nr:hypothetical protein [Acidobacteriota bacterium]